MRMSTIIKCFAFNQIIKNTSNQNKTYLLFLSKAAGGCGVCLVAAREHGDISYIYQRREGGHDDAIKQTVTGKCSLPYDTHVTSDQ